ncbi:hypothetical protein, partial [Bordetella pertussis]
MPGTAAYPLWADVVDNWSSFDAKEGQEQYRRPVHRRRRRGGG